MKKLLLILSVALFGVLYTSEVKAQGTASLKTTLTGSKTVDTTTAVLDSVKFVFPAANMKNGTFYVTCHRISGSPVITALLRVSGDGTYYDTRQVALQVNGDTANLKPLANAVKQKPISITQNNHAYYQLLLLNHTADSAKCSVIAVTRRD